MIDSIGKGWFSLRHHRSELIGPGISQANCCDRHFCSNQHGRFPRQPIPTKLFALQPIIFLKMLHFNKEFGCKTKFKS
jgi:hypothetical protein